jgi:hypothetical protein
VWIAGGAFTRIVVARRRGQLDRDRLDGARRRGAEHALPLGAVGGRVVPKGLLAVQLEDAWGKEAALGVPLAPIEIDHEPDGLHRRTIVGWVCSGHGRSCCGYEGRFCADDGCRKGATFFSRPGDREVRLGS